jgi:hypothetical protein
LKALKINFLPHIIHTGRIGLPQNPSPQKFSTSGKLRQAHALSRRATETAARRNLLESAGGETALTAEWSEVLGNCREARENIARASAYPLRNS